MKYSRKERRLIDPPYWLKHQVRKAPPTNDKHYPNKGTQEHITKTLFEDKKKHRVISIEVLKMRKDRGNLITTNIITTQVGEKYILPVYNKAGTALIHPKDSVFPIITKKVIHHFKNQ